MRMPIRVKLLILLLAIGLVPVALVTWFDLGATRRLGMELSGRARQILWDQTRRRILAAMEESTESMRRGRLLLEAQVQLQARQVERALAVPAPIGTAVWVPNGRGVPANLAPSTLHGGLSVSFDRLAASIRQDATMAAVGALPRLHRLVPFLRKVNAEGFGAILWHHVVLKGGARAVFPGRMEALSAPAGSIPWYDATLSAASATTWTSSIDPATGLPTMTVSTRISGHGDAVAGVTAIEASLSSVLDTVGGGQKPGRALLAVPMAMRGGGLALRLLAERKAGRTAAGGLILPADAASGLAEAVADMMAGRSGARRVVFDGEDSLLAYGGIDDFDTHLIYVVPYRDVGAEAEAASGYVVERLDDQRAGLVVALLGLAAGLVLIALAASRAVTRPVSQLASAARRLAAGDFSARTDHRSGDKLQELGEIFNRMVPQLRESIRMSESLGLAMEVQRSLLPQAPPEVPGFDIAGLSIYCDETGGDYYDFLKLPQHGPGEVAVVVGDVAGHGIPAALLMTTARALLRSQVPERGNLAHLMGHVNRHLVEDSHAGRFMTMFLALLDSQRREVHWVSAGHDPAIIYEPEGDVFRDMPGVDIPLGVDGEWRYHELFHSGWSDGAVLVIGTDGIWETRNQAGEMFGKDAIRGLIRANAGMRAQELARTITEALASFRGGRGQRDDITLVVVKSI